MKIIEIVNEDLCTGCGMCVSESPDELKMQWNKNGFLVPHGNETRSSIRVCPFNPIPEKEVEDEDKLSEIFLQSTTNFDKEVGSYFNTYAGYSKKFRETSSSGGIITFYLEKLLVTKIVDWIFIVKEVEGEYKYQLFNDVQNLNIVSKTRYYPTTMADLFLKINEIEGKIAICGLPCFLKAIRLKQYYYPELKEKIPFLIGIICGGMKSRFYTDFLAQKAGVKGKYTGQEYRIKDFKSDAGDYSFGIIDENGHFTQMKMSPIGDMWGSGLFKNNACDFCDDCFAELADISCGDAWIPPYITDGRGSNIIITRSHLAEKIIIEGIASYELTLDEIPLLMLKSSQTPNINHRQKGIAFRLRIRKSNNLIQPQKREKFFENIFFEYKLVQKHRVKLRKKSLDTWIKHQNAELFEKKLKFSRLFLRVKSRISRIISKNRVTFKI